MNEDAAQPEDQGRGVFRWRRWCRVVLPPIWRLFALLAVCWLMRDHHARLRIAGDSPLNVVETQRFWTNAASLKPDLSVRAGYHVLDGSGEKIGYVVRTMPDAGHITGYSGTTDTLVALDTSDRVKGMNIRSSEDTTRHAEDVMLDWSFKRIWNGMNWDEVARMDLKAEGIEGVSGATLTSMAVARGIVHRFAGVEDRMKPQPVSWDTGDAGLLGAVMIGLFLTFTKNTGRARARRWFHFYVIGYVGFLSGDLLAQSLLIGWAKSGVAWSLAPGLALLAVAALLVPWATKRPLYCQQICPHGAVQELLLRHGPSRWRLRVPDGIDAGLQNLPGLLLGFMLLVSMLPLGFDLAGFEPFDAYLIGIGGMATIVVAVVGLIGALFVPKAYCRYGCPTGALLEFVRSHGARDGFGRRDFFALLILGGVFCVHERYALFHSWLYAF